MFSRVFIASKRNSDYFVVAYLRASLLKNLVSLEKMMLKFGNKR